jgi:hypothetical protein
MVINSTICKDITQSNPLKGILHTGGNPTILLGLFDMEDGDMFLRNVD